MLRLKTISCGFLARNLRHSPVRGQETERFWIILIKGDKREENMKTKTLVLIFFFMTIISNTLIAGELEEREAIKKQTAFLLSSQNFKYLEKLAQEYRVNKSRTPSGVWKLTSFYYGIHDYSANIDIKDENYWNAIKSRTEGWIKEYSNSPTPYISHGIVMKQYAWKFRGRGFANTVPEEAWKPFREHLNNAKVFLEKHKAKASTDPHWYEVMADIANGLGMNSTEFQKIIEEGLKKEPLYYQLYFVAAHYFAPKWHGSAEDIENFANSSVAITKDQIGLEMYTRIYWFMYQAQYGERLFLDSNVVWEKMKKGIDDILKRYPDQWNINNFALFACLAKDKQKAKELFNMIKEPAMLQVWESESKYLRYKSWAYGQGAVKL
jgi:hypothetical protein